LGKNNGCPNVMVVFPSIEIVILFVSIWGLLKVELKTVHCTPDSIQH
jgi:hypothetical protein